MTPTSATCTWAAPGGFDFTLIEVLTLFFMLTYPGEFHRYWF
jgi:hypothetical protein